MKNRIYKFLKYLQFKTAINIKIIIFKYIMKYLNVFDNKSSLDSSVTSINHGDGAFVFGVTTAQGIEDVTIYD